LGLSKNTSNGAISNKNEELTACAGANLMDKIKRNWINRLIALIAGMTLLLALVHYAGFERFSEIVHNASPCWIVTAVLVYASSWIFRTWRLGLFTKQAGRMIGSFDLFKLYISGYALNVILPVKLGDVITVGYLKIKGIEIGMAAAIILQTRILDVLALVLLSVLALVHSRGTEASNWIITTVLISALMVFVPMSIVVIDKNESILNLLRKLLLKSGIASVEAISEKLQYAYGCYHQIISNKTLFIYSILLSLTIWLFEGFTCYAVSIAISAQVPILIIVIAVSVGNVGKSIPATPGSIGIYESMLAAVLIFFGVPYSISIAIAILDHVIKNLFLLVVGVPATMDMGLSSVEIHKVLMGWQNGS
jgi:uncharacterized protein (TIRG00374 family)